MEETKATKPKVYISGPMRGIEYHNRPKFNEWERELWDEGYEPVNPVNIGDGIARPDDIDNDPELLQKVFNADLRELSGCDAIFLLEGWEKSEHAVKELEYAIANGMDIILESKYREESEKYDADNLALRLERFSNRFGVHEDLKRLAVKMTEIHRTLVQSFTSGFVLQFIKKMAENRRADRFDDRDAQAVNVCDEMWKAVEEKYGLNEGEDIRLAMI